MNDTWQIYYLYLWRYGFVSGTFTDAYPIRDSREWRVFIEDVPIKCHSRDPAETDRRRHLSKSLRRNVKMTVRIISFELGSVTKATHCRLFHVRHLSKTVLYSTILSSSSCPSLAKSDPFQIFKIDPPEVRQSFRNRRYIPHYSFCAEWTRIIDEIYRLSTKDENIWYPSYRECYFTSYIPSRAENEMHWSPRRTIPSIINAYLLRSRSWSSGHPGYMKK